MVRRIRVKRCRPRKEDDGFQRVMEDFAVAEAEAETEADGAQEAAETPDAQEQKGIKDDGNAGE